MKKNAAQKAASKIATKERVMIAGRDGITFDTVDDPNHVPDYNKAYRKPPQIQVTRMVDQYPILRLFKREQITPHQFKAAERLYSYWYGGFSPSIVKPIKLIQVDEGASELNESEHVHYCQQEYIAALREVTSERMRQVIIAIVIEEKNVIPSAQRVFKKNGKEPSKQNASYVGMNFLTEGLDILGNYLFPPTPTTRERNENTA